MNKQTFSNINRSETVQKMKTDAYDFLVIGGGITGAGIVLDAVTRGMKVALVEMQDFAAGTSSRSTKLVHGGLRYLKQFEVKMVAEVGKERAIVYENGPHVTTPEWMLLPIHKGGTFGKFSTSVGLRVYDFLAGVKKSEKRKMLSREAALQKEPLVKKDGLQGGGYYVEYRTDDARLTIEVMKEAVQRGAHVLNYAKANQFIYQNKQIIGVHIGDLLSGEAFPVKAKKVVNAAGPWVDQVRGNDYAKNNKQLRLTKGVHLVISQEKFPLKQAIYFDTPDKRMVFAIPRDGKTYVGTTDTFFDGDKANPKMTKEDRDYILKAIQFMFPEVKVAKEDVESSWAGVRPLIYEEGKDPSEISRKDEVWEAESGLITIAGGKLTGYRKMAETVVNLVAERITESGSPRYKGCQTKHLPISGGDFGGSAQMEKYVESFESKAAAVGLPAEVGREIAQKYGTNAEIILKYVKTNKTNLPSKIYAELQYAIDHEMVYKPVDFFIRRTGALFFDRSWVNEWKKPVIDHMGKSLGWKKEEFAQYTAELEKELKDAVEPVDIQ